MTVNRAQLESACFENLHNLNNCKLTWLAKIFWKHTELQNHSVSSQSKMQKEKLHIGKESAKKTHIQIEAGMTPEASAMQLMSCWEDSSGSKK